MSTQAMATYSGSCTGHGTHLPSIHHPGFGGGTLSNCPHSPTDSNIVAKTVEEMDAVNWWPPERQLPDSGTQVTNVVINGKIPILDGDELISHSTPAMHTTKSQNEDCSNTEQTPGYHCVIGTAAGREPATGHKRKAFATSKTVMINGKYVARVGDPLGNGTTEYPCKSLIAGSSANVYIGI